MSDDIPTFDAEQVMEPGFLPAILEAISPSGLLNHLDRTRPYDGQPHTSRGERGRTELTGVTMRDVYDSYLIGAFLASGLSTDDYPGSIYDLPWDDMDPIAVIQNACVVLAKRAGIPSALGNPPSRCVFCDDEYPDLCPPRLHAMGNQTRKE